MPSYDEAIQFERRIAAIFRTMGATVEHNVSLAGNQIDILVSEVTKSGTTIRSAIECKLFSRPVGIDPVNAFAGLAVLLRDRRLIDKAILVSKSGFTAQARIASKEHGIDLFELADLENRVIGREADVLRAVAEVEQRERRVLANRETPPPKKAFIIMPFKPEFTDVYILGIRNVAEDLKIVAERADSIEHTQSIPDVVRRKIEQSDVIIADTTLHNPNVFYEIGLAHGIGKETILICRDADSIPFDLGAVNHIIYSSIVELREKLRRRLTSVLNI